MNLIYLVLISLSIEFATSSSMEREGVVVEFLEKVDSKMIEDMQFLRKNFDEDVTFQFMTYKNYEERRGLEEIKIHLSSFWKKTPDARDKISDIISLGNIIIVQGYFYGSFPRGERFEIPFIKKFLMRVDKIKHLTIYADFGSYSRGLE
jgi:predicted DNA-binding protein (UPF0251 family)